MRILSWLRKYKTLLVPKQEFGNEMGKDLFIREVRVEAYCNTPLRVVTRIIRKEKNGF